MKLLKTTLLSIAIVLSPCIANAAFPEGQWTATTYGDLGRAGVYSGIGFCLQAGGNWYGTTSSSNMIKGSGLWTMKGDNIRLHMNRVESYGTFSESLELTAINTSLLTGYWQKWNLSNSQNDYLTTKWEFTSSTCLPKAI